MAIKTTEGKSMPCLVSVTNSSIMIKKTLKTRKCIYISYII